MRSAPSAPGRWASGRPITCGPRGRWAGGPFFIAAFSFMLLGLPRHVGITVWEVARAVHRAGDKNIPYRKLIAATIMWLIPGGELWNQVLFSLTSFLFHVAILIVPIFLGGHIALCARGLGVSWPAISNPAADVLTIVAIVTAVARSEEHTSEL